MVQVLPRASKGRIAIGTLATIVLMMTLFSSLLGILATSKLAEAVDFSGAPEFKLIASDGGSNDGDWFGYSVALSGDTAVVGADRDDVGTNMEQGSAYIFVRNGTTWSQQAKLIASDGGSSDWFGYSVALSGDTVVVGALVDDVGANENQGSAYVFVRNGTTWSQQAHLTTSDGAAGDFFGESVAIDGDTAVVGADRDDVGTNMEQGSAYIFVRNGTIWSQQAKLIASDGTADDQFGYSVALSGDTAVVGAHGDYVDVNEDQGSAYVFVRNGTTWSQQAHLTTSDGAAGDFFGESVAIDGDTVVVGADRDDVGANMEQGSAYIFVRNGTTWSQQAKLIASDGTADDLFGYSVALSGDTAVVGAAANDVGANENQGSAYAFVRNGTTWSQQAKLIASDGISDDLFGYSVALSGDIAVVGARGLDEFETGHCQGSAYVYKLLEVDFSALPLSGMESVAVYFSGVSWSYAGIISWSWDFGDGNYSNQQNPTHQYAREGSYTVSLTVTDADAYSNTKIKIGYITITDAGPTADFWAMPLDSFEPLTIKFTDLSTSSDSIISWSWNFGDGESSAEQNPTHQYSQDGIYAVVLTITEADGDRDMEAKIVNTNVTDGTPPYTSGHNPDKDATGIPFDTNIMVHVIDDDFGVNKASIVMTVEGIVVTPVITGSSSDYMLIYHPPSDFGYKVDVTINASDLAGNIMPTDSYSFTTTALLMEGDVNLDGYVTITDAMLIARFKAGLLILTEAQLQCADTTDNGIVSIADAMHISQWLVDPNGSLGVLFKPLWQSPADDSMLQPIPK